MEPGGAAKPISANQACSANLVMSKGQTVVPFRGSFIRTSISPVC